MTARIPTANIDVRLRPLVFLHDRRLQAQLSPAHALAFINLLCHAVVLNAENDGEFVDGVFDPTVATAVVPHVTTEALAELLSVGLVDIVDDDRMRIVEFLPEDGGYQSSHGQLVADAERRAKDLERKRVIRGQGRASTVDRDDALMTPVEDEQCAKPGCTRRRELDLPNCREHAFYTLDTAMYGSSVKADELCDVPF